MRAVIITQEEPQSQEIYKLRRQKAEIPYIIGGGEKRFYEIGKRTAKKGHQVHLYGMKFREGANVINQNECIYMAYARQRNFIQKEKEDRFCRQFTLALIQ